MLLPWYLFWPPSHGSSEALLVHLLLLVHGLDLDESLLEFGLVTCSCMGFVSAVSWMDFSAALSFY